MITAKQQTPTGEELVQSYCESKSSAAKDRAVRAFLPLVNHILEKLNLNDQRNLTREDLYQFGVVGLLDALDRFDPNNGSSFKTYAYRRIHGEIIDAVRREGILSRDQLQKLNLINKVKNDLVKTLNREPSVLEIQNNSSLNIDEISKVISLANGYSHISLDESVNGGSEDESLSFYEVINNEDSIAPDAELQEKSIKDELKNLIQDLPEKERLILALYYYEELNLADIGKVLDLTEGRVSQILSSVYSKLRKQIKR